jgi:hypothetical protein
LGKTKKIQLDLWDMLFFAFAMHKWINLQEPFGAYIINCDELLSSNLLGRWKFSLSSQAADSCLSEQSAYSQGPLSCLSESKQPFNTLLSPWLNSRVISASWNHSLSKQSSPQRWWICVHPPAAIFADNAQLNATRRGRRRPGKWNCEFPLSTPGRDGKCDLHPLLCSCCDSC